MLEREGVSTRREPVWPGIWGKTMGTEERWMVAGQDSDTVLLSVY